MDFQGDYFELDDELDVDTDEYDEGEGRLECVVCKTPIMMMSDDRYTEYEGYMDTFDFVKWLEETVMGADGICRYCVAAVDKLVEHIDWPRRDYPELLKKVREARKQEIEHCAYQ